MVDVWHDAVTLSELQAKLLAIDMRETVVRSGWSLCAITLGGAVALASLVILLAAGAFVLIEQTSLSAAWAFGLAALSGLLLAVGLAGGGWWALRRGFHGFQRSGCEWRKNLDWFKSELTQAHAPGP
jgi:hypothetical protein